uniref:Uncharacterized protein n=1 Tax=Anguilla anguilla TaxID=7936 RepID=A0A0E9P8T8_ANGAN
MKIRGTMCEPPATNQHADHIKKRKQRTVMGSRVTRSPPYLNHRLLCSRHT